MEERFIGITTDGRPEKQLFERFKTGADMGPVLAATRALLDELDTDQRRRTLFAADDIQWQRWINIHRFPRQGIALQDMSEEQKQRAFELLRASLSAKGYKTSRDIMRLNHHLGELVSNPESYGEFLYWFAVLGEPSETEPWGWQLEGHHLIINFFVLGDQIVMTPTFMGSEPVTAKSGKYAGIEVLQDEQNAGLALMRSLNPQQQKKARIGNKESFGANVTEAYKDNLVLPFEGLAARDMTPEQRRSLLDLVGLYVANMREPHARVKMCDVRKHLDRTHFAWKGGSDPDAVFYYRIHSPVVLIEFDHAGTIALDGPRGVPLRRHIHTVVRTPNGNDYGKDLLRQHYESHAHDHTHGHPKRK